jgi:aspartokinase/homoserine dehydrogenase 1
VALAGVGAGMGDVPGIASRFFGALGRSRINVLALSDGASYQSVSVVIDAADARKATSVLHGAFLLSQSRFHLVLAGATGRVGSALRRQLATQQPWLVDELNLDVRVAGAINRTRMAWDPEGIAPDAVPQALADGEPSQWDALFERLVKSRLEGVVLVDCTPSEAIARQYERLLEAGVAVVAASKIANSVEAAYFTRLKRLSGKRGVPYRYETMVGAGLPILRTIEDLRRSGDQVHAVRGVVSGTLAYVLQEVGRGVPLSIAAAEARRRGLTEPDPSTDFTGDDVARKLLVLVREAGFPLERDQVTVEPFLPGLESLAGGDPDAFMASLVRFDAEWARRADAARAAGKRLAYLAEFDGTVARAGLVEVPDDSPFGRTCDAENVVVFETDRYSDVPLTVRGPGAGPEIAAAAVLADVVQAARELV